MDKVINGTPPSSGSLCDTCRHALSIQGVNFEKLIICDAPTRGIRINFPVFRCSMYDDKRTPSLSSMKAIAWEVKSRKRDPVGFSHEDAQLEVRIEPPQRQYVQEAPITDDRERI